jgi:predicted dehydrogenase
MDIATDTLLGTHSLDQALVLFGRPKSVTGFFRVQRDAKSEVEDSFTIILQYDGAQKDLLVTVKTSVVTPMAQQLKQLVRGTKGSFIKVGCLPGFMRLRKPRILTLRSIVPAKQHLHHRRSHRCRAQATRRRLWCRV